MPKLRDTIFWIKWFTSLISSGDSYVQLCNSPLRSFMFSSAAGFTQPGKTFGKPCTGQDGALTPILSSSFVGYQISFQWQSYCQSTTWNNVFEIFKLAGGKRKIFRAQCNRGLFHQIYTVRMGPMCCFGARRENDDIVGVIQSQLPLYGGQGEVHATLKTSPARSVARMASWRFWKVFFATKSCVTPVFVNYFHLQVAIICVQHWYDCFDAKRIYVLIPSLYWVRDSPSHTVQYPIVKQTRTEQSFPAGNTVLLAHIIFSGSTKFVAIIFSIYIYSNSRTFNSTRYGLQCIAMGSMKVGSIRCIANWIRPECHPHWFEFWKTSDEFLFGFLKLHSWSNVVLPTSIFRFLSKF